MIQIRIIELLKLRFGEQALQVCDVMLKDMADSKRIDDRIQGELKVRPYWNKLVITLQY